MKTEHKTPTLKALCSALKNAQDKSAIAKTTENFAVYTIVDIVRNQTLAGKLVWCYDNAGRSCHSMPVDGFYYSINQDYQSCDDTCSKETLAVLKAPSGRCVVYAEVKNMFDSVINYRNCKNIIGTNTLNPVDCEERLETLDGIEWSIAHDKVNEFLKELEKATRDGCIHWEGNWCKVIRGTKPKVHFNTYYTRSCTELRADSITHYGRDKCVINGLEYREAIQRLYTLVRSGDYMTNVPHGHPENK